MRAIIEEMIFKNPEQGAYKIIPNPGCDIMTIGVNFTSAGDFRVRVYGYLGDISDEQDNDKYIGKKLALFNLTDYTMVDPDDDIIADGIYEAGIEGVTGIIVECASVPTYLPDDKVSKIIVRFVNSTIA